MFIKKEKRKIPGTTTRDWVLKKGYETRLLADELDMDAPETVKNGRSNPVLNC